MSSYEATLFQGLLDSLSFVFLLILFIWNHNKDPVLLSSLLVLSVSITGFYMIKRVLEIKFTNIIREILDQIYYIFQNAKSRRR